MWVLIFLSTFHYSDNVSVTPVDDFRSEQACQEFGNAVVKLAAPGRVKFTCVRK